MSSLEYSSYESSTDEEFEQQMEELERQIQRDERAHEVWDLMESFQIRSPLRGHADGAELNRWLRAETKLSDIVHNGYLRENGKVALTKTITPEKINDFREVARAIANHYAPFCAKYSSYINNVTACIIQYHYNL